ncbi:OsmC family protein [Marinobacter sp. chi1]|uniref:OsmC family protein n=1 Tax=Marinobacter suaedae TaxID=3057675 RepID=A0ABT8VXI3_9GAMM|nr:OsmC family protein [Marinobacter sp. chi1]MDO3720707.1 OsmC family protein [Marinobacter sp. chi1]
MNMIATQKSVHNGINVEALVGARDAVTQMPAAAQFQWRAQCEWVNGTHCNTSVEGFFGLGEEQNHKQKATFDADHPEVFASEDNGITPVEYILVGLASCLTAGIASVAQYRNIQLHSVKASLEGDMDLRGILGADGDVRNGFGDVRVCFDIDADASQEDIEALVAQSQKRSAVFDILTNPTNVSVVVK